MQALVLTVHVLLALIVIGLVLLQQGKGADAGAAFGSGASATVFGASGAGSFLTKMTTLAAALFFVTSLGLAILAANRSGELGSVIDQVPAQEARPQQQQPAAPDQPADMPTEGLGGQQTDGADRGGQGASGQDRGGEDAGGAPSDLPPVNGQ